MLHTPILVAGKINSQGIEFSGALKSAGSFAGINVTQFALSFSTFPDDRHFSINLQLDLPGTGGLTNLTGSFQDQTLTLDGAITHWQPIPALDFNGTLHAVVPLNESGLDLRFDVTGIVLGVSSEFIGSLSSGSQGFSLFATGLITLKLPNGQKLVDLEGTIDLGKDTPFAIGLAADFSLPGTRAAPVHLEGSIGAAGFSVFGKVDDWVLVPGLAFDGFVRLQFGSGAPIHAAGLVPSKIPPIVVAPIDLNPLPKPADGLSLQIDVSTSLLGSNLRLIGSLDGNGSSFNLNLLGHVHFGGPLVAGVRLDLDATLVTKTRPLRAALTASRSRVTSSFSAASMLCTSPLRSVATVKATGTWLCKAASSLERPPPSTASSVST